MSSVNSNESLGTMQWDVLELAGHLRQERLFINSEQQNLQTLNEKVLYLSSDLAQQAWVTAQQRVNLNRLIITRPDCTPSSCCQRANMLENSQFTDAYKHFQYQVCLAYGEFLSSLRKSPKLLAQCLVEGDKLVSESMQNIIQSLASGLYGSCLLPEDKIFVLKLLRHLMYLQIVPSDNPRRLLRHGTCAFSRLYSIFHESLFSAKLFLTAALHGPIMQLLMEEEVYLDIDPEKILVRTQPIERLKKFGKEGTPEYPSRFHRHRQQVVNALARISQRFIVSIRENMHCFPTSVCWIVRQMAGLLTKSATVDSKEVHAICTDLVFTYFICPAIVNPEPYGITDAPISAVARFNLMQVGQILQMLSLIKYQNVDQKVFDLYRRFEKDSVSSIIDAMLDGVVEDLEEEPSVFVDTNKLQGLSRSAALFTESELYGLLAFLQSVVGEIKEEEEGEEMKNEEIKRLKDLLANLPPTSCSNKIVASVGNINMSPENTNKKGILGKDNTSFSLLEKLMFQITVGKARGIRVSSSLSSLTTDATDDVNGGASGPEDEPTDRTLQGVLVLPFGPTVGESIGLLSEQKVLCMEIQNNIETDETEQLPINVSDLPNGHDHRNGETGNPERTESQEKRTRFSLSHDEVMFEGSIGNTSDNLEVVSEAASNHSVASSLELETEDQNDNLSDMVSANVSERGTPNISGRDTPSSQITEGDDARRGESRQLDLRPSTISTKQSRSEIDDKFCKFEIKKLIEGDETVSLVSDTWSTDVLASDSETVEQQERFLLPQPPPQLAPPSTLPAESNQSTLDVSETASEAWSTDVLASDSERMTEVDTDDTASVARSDDTARSEIESRGEPEGGEETPPPVGNAGSLTENAGLLFRPIREDPIGQTETSNYNSSVSSRLPSAHNVTGHGGTKTDYRQNTIEYVDNNANNIGSMEPIGEDRLENFVEKLNVDDSSSSSGKSAGNNLNNCNRNPNKLPNGNVKEYESEATCTGLVSSSSSSASSEPPRGKSTITTLPPILSSSGSDVVDGAISGTTASKASTSTGAIPKSISFDMTAERGDKELLDEDQKNKRGFFGKLKLSLRNRRGKGLIRGTDDINRCYDGPSGSDDINGKHRLRRIMSEDVASSSNINDSTEDILAKYRRKPSVTSDTASIESNHSRAKETHEDERLTIDPSNIETSFAFTDAKRKLRKVLSMADLQYVPWTNITERNAWMQKENELVAFLQLQLAEAINLQDRTLIAHLHETLRCVRLFNDEGCRKLFNSLKDDYQKRSPYIAYLIRCRQGLLSTLAHLDRLAERVKSDRDAINNHLVSVCVRVFLEKKEASLSQFCEEFKKLTLADEKQDLVDNFLNKIYSEMSNDPIWQIASESQFELARIVVERTVMARVYLNALYPNGDGDIYRDQLLQDHIKKLARVVTPTHKDLHIPKVYHYECPWPWAQEELAVISAYKTPRDKLQCVFRCATTIMNLLSMASERGIPAADDLIPVLVYVIIKTNPPSLLSTVQYVDSFYGNRVEGEEQYWWTQFCSAIEFIKTMD